MVEKGRIAVARDHEDHQGPADELAADPVAAHHNTLGGDARIVGPALQVRDIHGSVHISSVTPAPSQERVVPRQLPPIATHFVNREAEFAELDRVRTGHPPSAPQIIVVSGPAGVGKTAFTIRWLSQRLSEFPDGQLYADLGGYSPAGPRDPKDVLEQLLRAIGATSLPVGTVERVALWRTLTAPLRIAVLLDNAVSGAQIRPLVPAGPGSVLAVTSRQLLTGLAVDGASLHQLDVLRREAALELLSHGTGARRIADETAAAGEIVTLCARLPLALRVAAAQLASRPRQPVSWMARSLAGAEGPLHALTVDGESAVRVALDASYRVLPPGAARLYRTLGTLPIARFSTPLVAAVGPFNLREAGALLAELNEISLLEDLGAQDYRFHDLVAAHARSLSDPSDGPCTEAAGSPGMPQADETPRPATDRRQETLRRFVDWCLHTATAAEAMLTPTHRRPASRDYRYPPAEPPPFTTHADALNWLSAHQDTLRTAIEVCVAAQWHRSCWQLVDACHPLFLRLRPAEFWVAAHRTGLAAARHDGDPDAESKMLTSGAAALRNAWRLDEAHTWYEQALRLARARSDLRAAAQALNGMGSTQLQNNRLDAAEQPLREAIKLRQRVGYSRGVALSRINLGQLLARRGAYPEAIRHLTHAHEALRAISDYYDGARALFFLGQACLASGAPDTDTGARHLRAALRGFADAGSRHWQARALEALGDEAAARGATTEARDRYREAGARYQEFSPQDATRLAQALRELPAPRDEGPPREPGTPPQQPGGRPAEG